MPEAARRASASGGWAGARWHASRLEAKVTVLKRILIAIRHPVGQNVIGLYAMQLAQFIVPLVTLPYVARVLEPSAFGLVVFSQGFALLLVVFIDWGFGFTGTRSAAENQTDPDGLSNIVHRVRGAQVLLAAMSV